eukprot:COSAG06_NODE_7095_length_2637_cov_2.256107_1_plen_51_part_00
MRSDATEVEVNAAGHGFESPCSKLIKARVELATSTTRWAGWRHHHDGDVL